MSEEEIYQNFVDWLGKTWWGLTPSKQLMPLMKARYTIEEAEFLIGVPHSATTLEDLAQLKGVEASILEPQLKKMCQQGLDRFIDTGAEGKGFRSARECARLRHALYGRPQEGGVALKTVSMATCS